MTEAEVMRFMGRSYDSLLPLGKLRCKLAFYYGLNTSKYLTHCPQYQRIVDATEHLYGEGEAEHWLADYKIDALALMLKLKGLQIPTPKQE